MVNSIYRVLTVFLAAVSVVAAAEGDAVKGRVSAAILNVRVLPGFSATGVSRLKAGDEVDILAKNGEWYQIVAPADSAVWIAAAFLKNEAVVTDVKLRSGPGIAYQPYGILPAGQKVKVLPQPNHEWVKIAPPPGLKAWVGSQFVKVSDADAAIIPDAGKTVADDDKIETPPPDRKNEELPFVAGETQKVSLAGVIVPADSQAAYVTHALVRKNKDGVWETVCFLHCGKTDLKKWEMRSIRMEGLQRRVKDWTRPIVDVEKMTPEK